MESSASSNPSLSPNSPSQIYAMPSAPYANAMPHYPHHYSHDNHYGQHAGPSQHHPHHPYHGSPSLHHSQGPPSYHQSRRSSYGSNSYLHEVPPSPVGFAMTPGTPLMPNGMPYVPIDMHYGHSMLPSNLLMNSPSFPPSMSAVSLYQMPPATTNYHPVGMPASSPYLTYTKSNSSPYDQLNVSRTIILKHLNKNVTLNELLNNIDVGPLEYIRFFSKAAPKAFGENEIFNYCYISFINSKVSINFHLKYIVNQSNFNKFKKVLNSEHLKISFNDTNMSVGQNNMTSKQDYIKLKTLNYILEFNATRSIIVKINLNESTVEEALDSFKLIMEKFGDHEDFKYSRKDNELVATVHFNSIDSAIKTYEYTLRRVQTDKQESIDVEADENDQMRYSFVNFGKDRCDKTPLERVFKPNNKKLASSTSVVADKAIDEEAIPENKEAVFEDEEDRVDSPGINHDTILEKNESIRNAIFVEKDNYLSNSDDNLSITSQNFDETYSVLSSNKNYYSVYPYQQPVNYQNHDPFNIGNRAIYLGNLHPNTTIEEIANNVRAGGLVESIRFHQEKRHCFITFIDPNVALRFYLNHQVLHQLIIHGYDITVGWAKTHSGPLNREIALAVTAGASRNVYIGIKLTKDGSPDDESKPKPALPSEAELRADFSKFGELEQINFYHNNDCGFLNFCNIIDAIKVVEFFEFKDIEKICRIVGDEGQFYQKYKNFKISFAKDRCGNPPKFSFKKNFGKVRKKIYVNNFYEPEYESKRRSPNEASEQQNEDPITDEAAMVFGIIKNDKAEEDEVESQAKEESEDKHSINDDDQVADVSCSLANIDLQDDETNEARIQSKQRAPLEKVDEKNGANGEEEDDDDDEEDDRSVLLGSDDTSSTTANNSNGNGNSNKGERKNKFFSNMVNSSDSFIPLRKKNYSNISLSSQSSKHKYPHYPMSPYTHSSSYFGGPHYTMSMPQTPKMGYSMYPPPSPAPIPPQMPHFGRSNSGYGYFPMMAPPMAGAPAVMAPPMFDPSARSNGFSGSQVMAQYLAKSQTDQMMYQPNLVYDMDDTLEYRPKKSSKRN